MEETGGPEFKMNTEAFLQSLDYHAELHGLEVKQMVQDMGWEPDTLVGLQAGIEPSPEEMEGAFDWMRENDPDRDTSPERGGISPDTIRALGQLFDAYSDSEGSKQGFFN